MKECFCKLNIAGAGGTMIDYSTFLCGDIVVCKSCGGSRKSQKEMFLGDSFRRS